MSDITNAERVWVYTSKNGDYVSAVGLDDGTEYIRADLVPQWQPIETAPRDGSKLMLCSNVEGTFGTFAPCEWCADGMISEEGFWLWWQSEPSFLTEVKNPTHWMPLPAPPHPIARQSTCT